MLRGDFCGLFIYLHTTYKTGATFGKQSIKTLFFLNDFLEAVPDDNIDLLLENLEQSNGVSLQNEDCGGSDRRSVLHVEHR